MGLQHDLDLSKAIKSNLTQFPKTVQGIFEIEKDKKQRKRRGRRESLEGKKRLEKGRLK